LFVLLSTLVNLRRVQVTFTSKEEHVRLVRKCAPTDYGPLARARDKSPRYSFWDYEGAEGGHPLSLTSDQIESIAETDETFDPAEFVTWKPAWQYPRNWGVYG
jgi:hypothetical protein